MNKIAFVFICVIDISINAEPCIDYPCDSTIVRALLDSNNILFGTVSQCTDSSNGRICAIRLSTKHISKIIPEIDKLDSLHYLDLDNNGIKSLPLSIGNIHSLDTLLIQRNALSKLPVSFCELSSLKYLNAYGNVLDSLPENIGNLVNLEYLELWSNMNISSVPSSIGNMKNLRYLSMGGNKFTTLPQSIGRLNLLDTLKLEYGKLEQLPDSIIYLTDIKYVGLDWNSLCHLDGMVKSWADWYAGMWEDRQHCDQTKSVQYSDRHTLFYPFISLLRTSKTTVRIIVNEIQDTYFTVSIFDLSGRMLINFNDIHSNKGYLFLDFIVPRITVNTLLFRIKYNGTTVYKTLVIQ